MKRHTQSHTVTELEGMQPRRVQDQGGGGGAAGSSTPHGGQGERQGCALQGCRKYMAYLQPPCPHPTGLTFTAPGHNCHIHLPLPASPTPACLTQPLTASPTPHPPTHPAHLTHPSPALPTLPASPTHRLPHPALTADPATPDLDLQALDSLLPGGSHTYQSSRLDRLVHKRLSQPFNVFDFDFNAPLSSRPGEAPLSSRPGEAPLSSQQPREASTTWVPDAGGNAGGEGCSQGQPAVEGAGSGCGGDGEGRSQVQPAVEEADDPSSACYSRERPDLQVPATASGLANAVGFWFTVQLLPPWLSAAASGREDDAHDGTTHGPGLAGGGGSSGQADFCTYPGLAQVCGAAGGTRCWQQALQFLPDGARGVREGEMVHLSARHSPTRVSFSWAGAELDR